MSKQLIDAGENVEEKVWRMPLNKNFDKLIDSKNADMQNINYVGGAGSTTACLVGSEMCIRDRMQRED